MEELQVDLFSFMALFEAVIVLLVVAVVFIVRSKKLSGRVQSLQSELKKALAMEPPEAISFDQYLRDEVIRNQGLIDQAAASDDDAEKQAAELLKMRKQFLELEVEARALEGNPVEFQDRLAAGMSELIEQLRPDPESVTETLSAESAESAEAGPLDIAAAEDNQEQRKRIDTQEAEFDRLRDVINNQQDAMAALREQLNARAPEIEDLDVIMAKLDEFEKHDAELQQCLALLEKENQRLKTQSSGGAKVEAMDPAQLSGLQSMLHNQQDTISNLQSLIQELAPGASKAKELAGALENIHRANLELNSCVAVLEDENAMLRAELEAVNTQLEAQDAAAAEAATADVDEAAETAQTAAVAPAEEALSIDDEPELIIADEEPEEEGDDEVQQLEIKVQELEALVEFKDAAIEELEKQYSTLESKYLAATGEKKVD